MTKRLSDNAGGAPIPVLMMAQELGWGGGIERDVSKFARHLAGHGIAAHVACFRPGGARWKEIEAAGIPTVCIPVTSLKSPSVISAAKQLKRYVTEHDIKVLHAFDGPTDLFGIPVARVLRLPSLTSQLWCRSILAKPRQVLLSFIDKLASGIFVNSYAAARELVTDWHVPSHRIHVCHNGFEPKEFHPHGRTRPPRLSDASVVIGTVAVLREEKNLPLLLDTFVKVHAADPRARLLIVGDGPMKPVLTERAEQLGLTDACIFQEATAYPADWMRAIDIFVLCSRSESFSNSLLEAMACGCCPVGSRVGGTGELVTHGETGLLFDSGQAEQLADALCRLVQDGQLRCRLATAATRFAHDHLTIDIAAGRLAGIYRQLLGQEAVSGDNNETVLAVSKC